VPGRVIPHCVRNDKESLPLQPCHLFVSTVLNEVKNLVLYHPCLLHIASPSACYANLPYPMLTPYVIHSDMRSAWYERDRPLAQRKPRIEAKDEILRLRLRMSQGGLWRVQMGSSVLARRAKVSSPVMWVFLSCPVFSCIIPGPLFHAARPASAAFRVNCVKNARYRRSVICSSSPTGQYRF
jgi:hypothetical protein